MKAIILSAGRGSRMRSLTKDKPKCLLQLAGRTLLQWQIEALRGAGIDEIAVVRGYMAHMLNEPGMKYFENPRWAETNMVMSLLCAGEWLRNDRCIVSYADIIYPSNTVAKLIKGSRDIAITYDLDWQRLWKARFGDPLKNAETFKFDGNGRLLEVGNKPKSIEEVKGQYMGLLSISPAGWEIIETYLGGLTKKECDRIDVTSLLQSLIQKGVEIYAVPINGNWYEVDDENDLKLYRSMAVQSANRLW